MKLRLKAFWISICGFALLLLAMGCNDTLRQFIVPVPQPNGDPGALAHAITLSTNPLPSSNGTDMHVDVTGDSGAGVVSLGINPVFLGLATNRAFVVNAGDASTPPTLSVYTALLPQAGNVTTVTLPNAAGKPVAGASSSTGNIYIANNAANTVDVVSNGVLAVTSTINLPAGDSGPVMIAGNSSNNQVFVINQGSGTVSQISAIDNTVVSPSITVGSNPIWGVMSTDGLFVFVVNQGSNNVSVIDTSLRTVIATVAVGASPNFAFYEPKLKRLYVSNTAGGTISVIKADSISATNPPVNLKNIPVTGGNPTSVTALSDGSKAYAAIGNCPASPTPVNHLTIIGLIPSCTGNLVSVIDAVGLRELRTIPVGIGPVSISASADASRVFVVNSHDSVTDVSGTHTAGTVSDIRTSTDTEVARLRVPQQDPNCKLSSTVFCPTQTPFVVRTFP